MLSKAYILFDFLWLCHFSGSLSRLISTEICAFYFTKLQLHGISEDGKQVFRNTVWAGVLYSSMYTAEYM